MVTTLVNVQYVTGLLQRNCNVTYHGKPAIYYIIKMYSRDT